MIVATERGEIGIADSATGYWRSSPIITSENTLVNPFDEGTFFNKDTGFLSGFQDIIYHTVNGGRSWQAVNFGLDGRVRAVYSLDNGEAWISLRWGGLTHTKDFGKTWQPVTGS